ncbi:hypothetical protein L1887_47023 [Cichorium endivia]|nr:hypothetical protein L1887_47023 [Cichorium endivia]
MESKMGGVKSDIDYLKSDCSVVTMLLPWKMLVLLLSSRLLARPTTHGTTTTLVLAREIIKLGLLSVTYKTVLGLIKEVEKIARPVKGREDIRGNNISLSQILLIYFIDWEELVELVEKGMLLL